MIQSEVGEGHQVPNTGSKSDVMIIFKIFLLTSVVKI